MPSFHDTFFCKLRFLGSKGQILFLYPIGNKYIGILVSPIKAIGRKDKFFAIGGKHWKTVKHAVEGNLFEARAVGVDGKKVERSTRWKVVVGGKDDLFS